MRPARPGDDGRRVALELLDASDDREELRGRHAHWYCSLGIDAGRQDMDAVARLRRDPGNVGLALAWTLEQFETGKLPAMIERAGYPGIAADLDADKIAAVLPALKKQALAMWEEGERLTGHPGLPLEVTPNLAAAE